jgi:hypothetical protein
MKRRSRFWREGTTAAREELFKVILVELEHWDLKDRLVLSKSCMRLSTYQVKTRLSCLWNTSAVNNTALQRYSRKSPVRFGAESWSHNLDFLLF